MDPTNDNYRFAWKFLKNAKVSIMPGINLGKHQARYHVRFVHTITRDRLAGGVARFQRVLA